MQVWLNEVTERLAERPCCGYHLGQSTAAEPTALAALALLHSGRLDAALPALAWLADQQNDEGSVGVTAERAAPGWPTGLAVLAWTAAAAGRGGAGAKAPYEHAIRRATRWILSTTGAALEQDGILGHDCTLIGWPWVRGTHSWVEPTAIQLLALQAVGLGRHQRAQEAARLLLDRQLPDGGCNYGNTVVWGQLLRPHVQPTGLAMWALARATSAAARLGASLDYLQQSLAGVSAPVSLGWALLGLAAHGRVPESSDAMLEAAYRRTIEGDRSGHKLALLALAGRALERHV